MAGLSPNWWRATLSVLAVVFGGYILLAVRARRLFTSAKAIRALNRGTGAVMAGAAAAIAARDQAEQCFPPISRARTRAGVKFQQIVTK